MRPRWRCAICAPGRRRCCCAAGATGTTWPAGLPRRSGAKAGTWSTSRRGRCARSPSIRIGWRRTARRCRCCRGSPPTSHGRGRFRRGHRRNARVRGRAGKPRGERAHARVGRSHGQRGAHRRAAARLPASAPLARRDARRALQRRSGERPLDLGPAARDAHAPDARPGQDCFPVWTPDGRRIIFSSNRGGQLNLWWQAADGTGAAERLTTSSNAQFVTGITPDGTAVVFNEATPTMGRDLLQLALDGTRRVTPLLQTKFDERNGIVSPDGRWLAYESNSSGSFEIYVRPFPNVGGGQRQVSTAGEAAALGAERQGTVLRRGRWCAAARAGGGERRDLERRHADEAPRGALRDRRHRHLGPHVRRVARRPALPDDQSARDRRGRRAARAHRRATLGRGAEAPRADRTTMNLVIESSGYLVI